MPTRTEAIKKFLLAFAPKDLAEAYNANMECQVNVAQDDGERVEGDYKGRQWHGWTNGLETWKSFRIPFNANSDPTYEDTELKFDLVNHAEGIGMTGWDWKNKASKWVAFDFDAITGHSDKHSSKLSPQELEEVKQAAMAVDWVTVRKSTSGKGLHLYVYLQDVPTENHTVHAALGRAILGMLSAVTGFNFSAKVDSCGGNMWVWHRKRKGTDGLDLIKQGSVLPELPPNWREHVAVITGKRRRIKATNIDSFEELAGQCTHTPLDEEHKKLLAYLQENNCFFWWDADHHMLVCHTYDLQQAHETLNMKGVFRTNSPATDRNEQNAFGFPMRHGAWIVRRYTPGVQEDLSWEQDGQGWTRCFLNREPTLKTAALSSGGLENEKGDFIFQHAEMAQSAALKLKANIQLPPWILGRRSSIHPHKDGKRIIVSVDHQAEDSMERGLQGWLLEKGKWVRIYDTISSDPIENDTSNFDDIARHLITESLEDAGWVVRSSEEWKREPYQHVRVAIESMGLKQGEVKGVLGTAVFRPWKLVNRPFQPEYIGDRQWNRNAPQLRFVPSLNTDNLQYPTWLKILAHVGKSLDLVIQNNGWAKANGILTGADYLKCWVASIFQEPLEPLPYLFFYGPQNSGKSIFHEALSLLITTGYVRADNALKNPQGFNGELESAIFCVIEETDLAKNKQANLHIKDWVTSHLLPIHKKRQTPYTVPNSTKWIQCSNDYTACPIFPGDTRITTFYVEPLEPVALIPKKQMFPLLEKEAPDFLAAVIGLEIPRSPDRLNIPVIASEDKRRIELENRTMVEIWVEDHCYYSPGNLVKFSVLYDKFRDWLDPQDVVHWSKIRFGQYFSANMTQYPKGRSPKNGQWYIGNISLTPDPSPNKDRHIIASGEMLCHKNGEKISHD